MTKKAPEQAIRWTSRWRRFLQLLFLRSRLSFDPQLYILTYRNSNFIILKYKPKKKMNIKIGIMRQSMFCGIRLAPLATATSPDIALFIISVTNVLRLCKATSVALCMKGSLWINRPSPFLVIPNLILKNKLLHFLCYFSGTLCPLWVGGQERNYTTGHTDCLWEEQCGNTTAMSTYL